jgi:hypothetical protein
MGVGPGSLGFVYFAGVKFVGYCGYAAVLNGSKAIARSACKIPEAWKSGLVGTGIGIAVGAVVGIGFWKIMPAKQFMANHGRTVFLAGLIPVRILEWYFFLWLMYRQCNLDQMDKEKFIFIGILVSFLLDAIGIFAALFVPGGAWIC